MTAETRITVVGLGPASPELLTAQARQSLEGTPNVMLRTRHHPAVQALAPMSDAWRDCDDLYQRHAAFEDVYAAVVERVLGAAAEAPVVYAVPGHPLVAERSVVLLLAAAREAAVTIRVQPAISYIDLAATSLGIDLESLQLCDALDLRIDTQRPALVGQLYDRDATTALKLRLLDVYPADHVITLLSNLGGSDESVQTVPLSEIDHRPFGFLDSLYLPAISALEDLRRFDGIAHVIERLHGPGGCPWDREQTHSSLRPYLLEESYETLEAIDSGDGSRLTEELGDVLLQVLMHAAVAEREGTFSFGDVTEHIARKLIRRHPHVFGETTARTAEEVHQNWEKLKQAEKPRDSILEGVPRTLPSLAASQSIQGRARRIGFDWPDIEGPLDKLLEEIREFARAESASEREDEFGDILFVVSNIGQRLEIDAEQALRLANEKFRRRFGVMERLAKEQQRDLQEMTDDERDALWNAAKAELSAG